MKTVLSFIALFIAFSFNSSAQEKASPIIEKTIAVYGDCDMCKINIEKAASYVKGVKKATWNKETNELTVIYREDKTTLLAIEEAIAKKGYDTQNVKGDQQAYDALPECCHYRSTKKH